MVTQYGNRMPAFTGEAATSFVFGLLCGSVHGELTVREIVERVTRRWPTCESVLAEVAAAIEFLEDWGHISMVGHHSAILSCVVRLSRRR